MAGALAHRGPDAQGIWNDSKSGLVLAHRRLSIVDLSTAGQQPMCSESERYVIVFNGEIYNHLELRKDLEQRHSIPSWRGTSDTETLLSAIDKWGITAAFQRSVGMFAAAVWDTHARELTLVRDRVGEKPLYYGWQNGHFFFASELKAIVAHPVFEKCINALAVKSLIEHNYIASPYSIWDNISKLPPAAYLTVRSPLEVSQPKPYWSLFEIAKATHNEPFRGDRFEALALIERSLMASVSGQMLSDVPLGALLSGGIDSSLVVALMQQQSFRPVKTFSIGFRDSLFDESVYARNVAKHLGTDHSELLVTASDVLAVIPEIPRVYDEPFADSSQLPTAILMAFTKGAVTVALTGDGGDEVFGGYNRYWMAPRIWESISWLPCSVRTVLGSAIASVPAHIWSRLLCSPARLFNGNQAGRKVHRVGARLAASKDFRTFYQSFSTEWNGERHRLLLRDGDANTNSISHPAVGEDLTSEMMAIDTLTYLPDDILVKVDRAAMAVSLETRAPFLDHRVIEIAWKLPTEMKTGPAGGKIILKELLNRHLPRNLFDRPKMGFSLPLDEWLRGPLREWAESLLSTTKLSQQGFLNPKIVRAAWQEHLAGAPLANRLWSALMLQAWVDAQ
jgi:asparagine synthase (glutamine-hydrolysing)